MLAKIEDDQTLVISVGPRHRGCKGNDDRPQIGTLGDRLKRQGNFLTTLIQLGLGSSQRKLNLLGTRLLLNLNLGSSCLTEFPKFLLLGWGQN